MNAPDSWLLAVADNSQYSTRSRLLFVGLSFAIGILTFLLYLAISYACGRRRQRGAGAGDQEAGMSDAAIAALPTFVFEQADTQTAMDCAVCLGQVEAGEKVRRFPKCAHLFHADCVDAWLRAHSTCPMCRAAVTSPKKDDTTPPAAATATAEALPPDVAAAQDILQQPRKQTSTGENLSKLTSQLSSKKVAVPMSQRGEMEVDEAGRGEPCVPYVGNTPEPAKKW